MTETSSEKYYKKLTDIMTVEIDPGDNCRRVYHFRCDFLQALKFNLKGKLHAADGVANLYSSGAYSYTISKGYLYSWEEVESSLVDIVQEFEETPNLMEGNREKA